MSEELQELQEHAEHAKHDHSLAPVTLTMALLAVLVATVSLLGHRTHTEEVILQNKVSDEWAYYQAKNIRRHTDELFADLTGVVATNDAALADQLRETYSNERRRADRYDLGEVFLEIALVITSITLLSGRRIFWHAGILLGVAGFVVAGSAIWLH